MLQEEGLDGSEDAAGPSFFLEYRVVHLLVEEEALGPRVMETASLASEQKLLYSLRFLRQ